MRKEEDIIHSQEICKTVRASLYANPTYDWMVKDLGLSPVVSPLDSSSPIEMKLWRMKTKETEAPECIRTFSLPETVTCVCANEDNEILVLGCKSGTIYYIQGDLSRSRRCNPIRFSHSFDSPITGVHIIYSEVKFIYEGDI